MGTIVKEGSALGVVVRTGAGTQFGAIAVGLGERHSETAFQVGLRKFSFLLVRVAGRADGLDLRDQPVAAPAVHRRAAVLARDRDRPHAAAPARDRDGEPLDRLAAPGPAQGAREAAGEHRGPRQHHAALHRQDGHAHRGQHHLRPRARPRPARANAHAHLLGLVCNEAVRRQGQGGERQRARRRAVERGRPARSPTGASRWKTVCVRPFDHERRLSSIVADEPDGAAPARRERGARRRVAERAPRAPAAAAPELTGLYRSGARVIAVASRDAPGLAARHRCRRATSRRSSASSCSSTGPRPTPVRRSRGSAGSGSR